MKNKSVFTAIVLITIGVLFLLQFFHIVHFSWWAVLHLWPLILVWIGIKCIPIQEPWKLFLKVLLLLFGIFLLFYYSSSHCGSFHNRCYYKFFDHEKNHICKTIEIETSDNDEYYIATEIDDEDISCEVAKLDLSAAAGKLTFARGASLFSIEKNESSPYFKTKIHKTSDGKKANITASFIPVKNYKFDNNTLKYNVFISDVPVWEMALELSATANEIDLSAFKVKELQIEANASSVELTLGNLYEDVDVNIESNASAVELSIPKDMKCIINKDNALSSMKVYGFKKQKEGCYLSDDGTEPVGTVRISVGANVSSVEIRKY